MEQCAIALLGTTAFFLHTVWRTALFLFSFPCAWLHSRDLLLDLSRLLDLTLRPLRSCLVMPPGTLATLEAGTCAGSREWNFSTFPFPLWYCFGSFFFFSLFGATPHRIDEFRRPTMNLLPRGGAS